MTLVQVGHGYLVIPDDTGVEPTIGEPTLGGQNPDDTIDYLFANQVNARLGLFQNGVPVQGKVLRLQAIGVINNPSTGSTTYVDFPDMTITFTTTVVMDILALFSSPVAASLTGNQIAVIFVLDGGTGVGQTFIQGTPTPNNANNISANYLFSAIAPGSHTIKVQWLVQSGTVTAGGTNRYLQLIGLS